MSIYDIEKTYNKKVERFNRFVDWKNRLIWFLITTLIIYGVAYYIAPSMDITLSCTWSLWFFGIIGSIAFIWSVILVIYKHKNFFYHG